MLVLALSCGATPVPSGPSLKTPWPSSRWPHSRGWSEVWTPLFPSQRSVLRDPSEGQVLRSGGGGRCAHLCRTGDPAGPCCVTLCRAACRGGLPTLPVLSVKAC